MKRSLMILALFSLFWWTVPHGAFGQSIICIQYDKDDCLTHPSLCSWCDSTQQCIGSDWPCPACEDLHYVDECGSIFYPGCKRCPLTHTCADIDKPCYCGNGKLNYDGDEECDSTPHCDPVYCTCGEGYIKDLNHPPYCCCDGCACNGIASTDSNVCSGHGVCIGTDNCLCFEGWTGSDCSDSVFDSDGDGISDDEDNCPNVPNPDQFDTDWDGKGDVCDDDDDNDGVNDHSDNCQYDFNPNQADFDEDGAGDICDIDDDSDEVLDANDQCLYTVLGEIVNDTGCSIADLCPCNNPWKNHGAYVKCVAQTSEEFVAAGLITEEDKNTIVSLAAQSTCGHKKK